jgi:hypothetical protein
MSLIVAASKFLSSKNKRARGKPIINVVSGWQLVLRQWVLWQWVALPLRRVPRVVLRMDHAGAP